MFFDCKVRTVATGSNHVAVLTSATPDDPAEPLFDFNLPKEEAEEAEEDEEDSENSSAHDGEEEKEEVKETTVLRE
jgi:hypothetical protein